MKKPLEPPAPRPFGDLWTLDPDMIYALESPVQCENCLAFYDAEFVTRCPLCGRYEIKKEFVK